MKRLTAKEYYYAEIAPEEYGKTYAEMHIFSNNKLLDYVGEDRVKELRNILGGWSPKNSNDYLIDKIMQHFIFTHSGKLRDLLEGTFIVKRKNYFANAAALITNGSYDGDLIAFNVGLSDAAFGYAVVFNEFRHVTERLRSGDYAAPKRFAESVEKILRLRHEWRKTGSYVLFREAVVPERDDEAEAGALAACTDHFILAHEIAHHWLGHTDDVVRAICSLPTEEKVQPLKSLDLPLEWNQELGADSAAISIIIGNSASYRDSTIINATVGALLLFLVLGHLAGEVNEGSKSHPPIAMRVKNVLSTLGSVDKVKVPIIQQIATDIDRFDAALRRIEARATCKS
jgi:hypothetical protein